MPRKLHNALTPLAVKSAKPGRHADGNGLQLLVKDTGARSWVYRFMLNGKSRDIGLGPAAGADAVSLANARLEATALRLKVKSGIDPIAERDKIAADAAAAAQAAKVAAVTFKEVAENHITANEDSWRNAKHRQQWRNTLATYAYPVIGDLPVASVETSHLVRILDPIWREKPETASRLRGRIETILDAAKTLGYRKGENPALWRGHLAQIFPVVSKAKAARNRKLDRSGHHKALPYAGMPGFMEALGTRAAVAARALEFLVLTAARTSEVLGATWSEIDLDEGVWTVPADRMKAGKEHRVPLSPAALAALEAVKDLDSPYLFPGTRGGQLSTMAMAMLMRRMEVDATPHGFRSSFRDWASERTNFAHEVCEMALAHAIPNKSEAAYRRGDLFVKRRRLMEAWASYCGTPSAAGGTVTQIRSAIKA